MACGTGEIATGMTRLPPLSNGRPRACEGTPVWRYLTALTLLVTTLALAPVTADAQSGRCQPARRVAAVDFAGSPRFDDDTLSATIVTQAPSVWNRLFGIGDAPCSDTLEIRRDALRIAVLHRSAGWFTAMVVPRVTPGRSGIRVLFDIVPGPEALLDTVRVAGVPDASEGRRPFDAPLRTLENQRFDRSRVAGAVAETLARLRDAGYARAIRGESTIGIDTLNAKVVMDVAFVPGPRMTLGNVNVEVQGIGDDPPKTDSAAVLRVANVSAGQRFRASRIVEAQRDLYRSEAFRFVLIDTVTPAAGAPDSVIDLRVTVAEARTRYARAGVGWATQDCIRLQGRVADRSFLGVGRRAELNVRASKIGRGDPADFAPGLCSSTVRRDSISSFRLNYFVGLSLSDTRLFGTSVVPVFTVYSERRGEPLTYLRETDLGTVLDLTRQFTRRTVGTAGFQYENGRTVTDPVVSCSRFAQCRPEDYALSQFGRGLGIVSTAVTHDRTNDAISPSRGQRLRGELRAGQTFSEIVTSLRFYRTSGEASAYRALFGGVIATRLQLSRAFAPGAQLVDGSPLLPQQERLYAGGQNSVRGFQQNLLGPVIYVVTEVTDTLLPTGERVYEAKPGVNPLRTVPRGGTALVIANLEYRRSFPSFSSQVEFAAFVDAGNVWETTSGGFRRGDSRATPGVGVRVGTPLGPFRLDVGYQPYPPRAGRALYFTSGSDGNIYCASPGNTVDIGRIGDTEIFNCPESFRPPNRTGALSRLVFHFGLGQAF